MKREALFLIVLIVIVLALIVFKPSWAWSIRNFFSARGTPAGSESQLLIENQSLKAEVAKLEGVRNLAREPNRNAVIAFVYSRYPFDLKNELLVSAGEDQSVAVGQAVVYATTSTSTPSSAVFIGRVEKVFKDTAVVKTLFDPDFQMAVRIGALGTDSLLKGGASPRLTLIPKSAKISEGDIVYTASKDFPYGLAVGEVSRIAVSSDNLFAEASIGLPYDILDINSVVVIK